MSPLLEMHGIDKRFGATHALRQVDLQVRANRVMALIGENGAGKSTLMKVLSGAIRPDRGHMRLGEQPYSPHSPHAARLAGVAMIYQELNLAPDLSVEDNIMLGQEASNLGLLRRREQRRRVHEALELLGHGELRPEVEVGRLSVAAQQLVEIARALVTRARLVVFDEPTSSLTQGDVEHLFRVIRRLHENGIGVVYISHFLEEIRQVCDDFTVLRDGRVAGCGSLADVTEPDLIALMVGRTVNELFPTVPHQPGPPVLSLESFAAPGVRRAEFQLRKGEILGLAGLVGAGRTELMRAIYGLAPVRAGRIAVRGFSPGGGPHGRIRAGLGMVSEDRKSEGLAQNQSIVDNLTQSRLSPYSLLGVLNLRRRQAAAEHWMQKLHVKARSAEQEVQNLSGGNQQKVAIARVMHQQADVFLLDEPTRGIDMGAKAEIYRLIGELAAAGKAVIFVSSYLPELLAVCDRIGVMSRGVLREVRDARDWTEEQVMAAAVSGGA